MLLGALAWFGMFTYVAHTCVCVCLRVLSQNVCCTDRCVYLSKSLS